MKRTEKGRVVYDRPLHLFKWRDVARIISHIPYIDRPKLDYDPKVVVYGTEGLAARPMDPADIENWLFYIFIVFGMAEYSGSVGVSDSVLTGLRFALERGYKPSGRFGEAVAARVLEWLNDWLFDKLMEIFTGFADLVKPEED